MKDVGIFLCPFGLCYTHLCIHILWAQTQRATSGQQNSTRGFSALAKGTALSPLPFMISVAF
jgi:hypothetical protein